MMNMTKAITVLSAFLLAVCLVFSITALTVLRNAVAEGNEMGNEANELIGKLNGCVDALNEISEEDSAVNTNVTVEADILCNSFTVKAVSGKVGVFSSDGTMLWMTELSTVTLPENDRKLLEKGITIHSWKELTSLLRDYGIY